MTTTGYTPATGTETTTPAAPAPLRARAGRLFARRPVAMGAAILVAAAWTLLVYGLPYTDQVFPYAFPALIAGPVLIPTLVLAHARKHWWRAVAVPVLVLSVASSSMVPMTIAALAWFWYRAFYADAPWGAPGEQVSP